MTQNIFPKSVKISEKNYHIPKLIHEMPTNMISILSFGKLHITNRARISNIDFLRFRHVFFPLVLNQFLIRQKVIQNGMDQCNVNCNVFCLVTFVRTLRTLGWIFKTHDNIGKFITEMSGDMFSRRILVIRQSNLLRGIDKKTVRR